MSKIISGVELSKIKKDSLKLEVLKSKELYGRVPCLVVILVGDNQASLSYIAGKEKGCNYVGIDNKTIKLPEQTTQEELLKLIDDCNKDNNIDGILVQLPLPKHIDEKVVLESISYTKDVDGFHPMNTGYLWQKQDTVLPCTAKGIIDILDYADVNLEGKNCVVIGRSNIVGLPVSKLLLDRNATVTMTHSKTKDLAKVTSSADVVIVAIGKAKFFTEDMVKENACVIDVGINRDEFNKLCGDVDFDNVSKHTSVITKVPGGVGPMTIACLLENTYYLYLKKFN